MLRAKRERHTIVLALLVSLLLHGGLYVLLRRVQREPPPAMTRRSVEIELVERPAPAVEPEPVRPQLRGPSSRKRVARAPVRAPAGADDAAAGAGGAAASAAPAVGEGAARPRRLDLFPGLAIGRGAEGSGELEGDALAQARLDGWAAADRAWRRAESGDVTPAIGALQQRFGQWFAPDEQAVVKASPLGVGLAGWLRRTIVHGAEMPRVGTADEALLPNQVTLMDPRQPPIPLLCLGNCYNQPHNVWALETHVEVQHDEVGKPADWKVVQSSGDKKFDAAALDAVADGTAFIDAKALVTDRPAQTSRWAFSATAYRWGRLELMLDPQWTPPGKEIESESGISGKSTIVREVRLLAVIYR